MQCTYKKLFLSLGLYCLNYLPCFAAFTTHNFVEDIVEQAKENIIMQRIDERLLSKEIIFEAPPSTFKCKCLLEKGSHATCALAQSCDGQIRIVLKIANNLGEKGKKDISDEELATSIALSEIEEISRPYFPKFDPKLFETCGCRTLAMEYCDRGDLLNFFAGKEIIDSYYYAAILDLLINSLKGLKLFHDAGYIHRDIKAENFFLNNKGEIKLADFGYAMKETAPVEIFCGTVPYTAPECSLLIFDQKTDIYALGMTFFYLLTRNYPYRKHERKN